MYYGKLESDELATIKLRRYWVNILSQIYELFSMRIKNHFQINSFTPSSSLKQRLKTTRKWSIADLPHP